MEKELYDSLFIHFTIKCPNCGNEFLPWRTLTIITPETGFRNHCHCKQCGQFIDRDTNYIKDVEK